MYIIHLLVTGAMLSCMPIKNSPIIKNSCKLIHSEAHTVRITYYSTDAKWGNQVACQQTERAKEGTTVAAHPDFKFGTKIYIPGLKGKIGDGTFTVQDRGSAVTSKKAAKGKAYVFDIYVASNLNITKYAHSQPEYMKIYIVKL